MNDGTFERWAAIAAAEAGASRNGFASHHLDDLGIVPDILTSLDEAIDIVHRATRAIEAHSGAASVRLAVRAGWVGKLATELPSLDPWSLTDPEPPSLYFLEHWTLALPTDREGYRCPYELAQLDQAGIVAEYDCSRRLEDRVWDPPEWTRIVWFFSPPRDS